MTDVKHDRPAPEPPAHVFVLLDHAMRRMRGDLTDRLRALDDDAAGAAVLRSSQIRLLSLTPPDGMRVTDLAQRVGMTAQALGEFVRPLVDQGLLTLERDPADRRARLVTPTDRGRAAARAGDAAVRAMEKAWRRRLGAADWDTMRRVLRDLAER